MWKVLSAAFHPAFIGMVNLYVWDYSAGKQARITNFPTECSLQFSTPQFEESTEIASSVIYVAVAVCGYSTNHNLATSLNKL